MLNRRTALVALFTAPLGYFKAMTVSAQSKLPSGPASLTIDLDQWSGLTVKHKGKSVFILSSEIYAALKGVTDVEG